MKLHYCCTVIGVPACVVKPLYLLGVSRRLFVFDRYNRYTERMSDESALPGLIKQRDELKRARETAVERSELPVMDEPGFMESNLRHIESIDTLLANAEKAIRDQQEE